VGPTYRSNLVNLHKVADNYNELFHQFLVNFTRSLRCEREIFNSGSSFDMGPTCIYRMYICKCKILLESSSSTQKIEYG